MYGVRTVNYPTVRRTEYLIPVMLTNTALTATSRTLETPQHETSYKHAINRHSQLLYSCSNIAMDSVLTLRYREIR